MSELSVTSEWEFLIGYPLEEAEQILREEAVPFEIRFTAAPDKVSSIEDAYVIAVRGGEVVVLICASTDWDVN